MDFRPHGGDGHSFADGMAGLGRFSVNKASGESQKTFLIGHIKN